MIKYSKEFDWPFYASNEDIERNVKEILDKNELLKEECKKYNFELVNTSRAENREKALRNLTVRINN